MSRIYKQISTQERAVVMCMRDDGSSIRSIAKRLCRSASTISREIKRTIGTEPYDANFAHSQSQARRFATRRSPKLHPKGSLFAVVHHYLKLHWSPQQIAGKLKEMWHRSTLPNRRYTEHPYSPS